MYITLAEAKAYWVTWTDAQITEYINISESILNSMIWVDTLSKAPTTELHAQSMDWHYYLYKMPSIWDCVTHFGWTDTTEMTRDDDYILRARRLTFYDLTPTANKFWMVKITYNTWYDTIPNDIKQAMYLLVSWAKAKAKSEGISNYSQGDVSMTYTAENFWTTGKAKTRLDKLVNKYILVDVIW